MNDRTLPRPDQAGLFVEREYSAGEQRLEMNGSRIDVVVSQAGTQIEFGAHQSHPAVAEALPVVLGRQLLG